MRLRSSFWAGFLILALVAIFLAAGFWQMARAHYKERMQAEVEAAASDAPLHAGAEMLDAQHAHLRRLEAQGTWLPERTILLDNKVQQGVVGYEVLTPLRLAEGDLHLLVNRGWVRAPQLRSELPKVETPTGKVQVEGIARIPSSRFIELGNETVTGTVWQNLTVERYKNWSQLPLQPVVLYQEGGSEDGLQRVEAAPEAAGINADRHRGYAITWFSLAGVTAVMGLLGWRKSKQSNT
jgi:surfeit locus 1 family protein